MITVHLVRHGETVWHAENRYAGTTDVALTARGRAQAAALVPWAESEVIEVVASSDLQRAEQTARVVADAARVSVLVDPGFREVDFGHAEGMTREEMRAAFPRALEAFVARPASCPLPGGETGSAAADRAMEALMRLLRDRPDEATIAVVAHTTLIRLMLCRGLGIPLDDYRRRFPALHNATITTLSVPHCESASELSNACALLQYNARPTAGVQPGSA